MQIFLKLGLVEVLDSGTFYMSNIELLIGQSSTEAERKRVARLQNKALSTPRTNGGHLSDIRRRPMIITTNLKLAELKNPPDLAHARIYDRILERCAPILFAGKNFREENAGATKQAAKDIVNRYCATYGFEKNCCQMNKQCLTTHIPFEDKGTHMKLLPNQYICLCAFFSFSNSFNGHVTCTMINTYSFKASVNCYKCAHS